MTEAKLKDTLRLMVHRYGFERVEQSLHEMRSDHQLKSSKQGKMQPGPRTAKKPKKRKAKVTAPEYVAKMELSAERESAVIELAKGLRTNVFCPHLAILENFAKFTTFPNRRPSLAPVPSQGFLSS